MKKKKKKLHLFLGCVLVAAIAIFLFPDKNIAMQADHPTWASSVPVLLSPPSTSTFPSLSKKSK